ncbi:PCC domain-containing protein [Prochlorococcus marinus]|uniref:Glutaredoxin and related protein n=1 Tax=Prochlorococcus marinus (strain MIT 9211) TaxID=93059 RepID=A9BAN1_PROM4|nr:DUF296 domain-containing protein [Prochlorococcus marinus]ABX08893.1 Glutaredoxin and related protein [Prochlorococcus marinus str. MIT 9211]
MFSRQIHLKAGDDLRASIEEYGRQKKESGFVTGIVGNLSAVAFQCPGIDVPTIKKGNLEIITLNGTFTPSNVHLHLSFSDSDCKVWGGHLELGTIVLKQADILLTSLDHGVNSSTIKGEKNTKETFRLEIAVIPDCPWSNRALRMIKSSNIAYRVTEVNSDDSFKLVQSRSGSSTFPQIFIDDEYIGGYEEFNQIIKSGKLF